MQNKTSKLGKLRDEVTLRLIPLTLSSGITRKGTCNQTWYCLNTDGLNLEMKVWGENRKVVQFYSRTFDKGIELFISTVCPGSVVYSQDLRPYDLKTKDCIAILQWAKKFK
jgi:hypothetical protein